MRKVICEECRKHYDYDEDDFCPKCGAFNRPAQTQTQWAEGIREDNHQGSFAHAELHEENRDRRGGDLAHGMRRVPPSEETPSPAVRTLPVGEWEQPQKAAKDTDLGTSFKKAVGYFIAGIVALNLLARFLGTFF